MLKFTNDDNFRKELLVDNLLSELKAVLMTTPQRWTNLCQNISDDLLRRQPLPNEWSALECLQHLVDVERYVFPVRVKSFLAGEDFPAYHPDIPYSEMIKNITADELASEFAALRSESLKLLDTVKDADLEREATHSRLGILTLSQHLHEWAAHDLNHLVQAEQAMMQPFIAGSGALDIFFEKHVAKAE